MSEGTAPFHGAGADVAFPQCQCHCLHQRKESEELPTIREKGRLARQVLHNTVVEGVTAVGFVPSVFIL